MDNNGIPPRRPQNEDQVPYQNNYDQHQQNELRRTRANNKPHNNRISFESIVKWGFTIIGLLIVAAVGLFAYYAKDSPSVSQTQLQSGGSSALYTTNGKLLLSLGSDKRDYVKYDQIPQQLKDAVISIEDKNFYKEKFGIDPVRIGASVIRNLRGNSGVAGGSTITQQLIKLSVFSTNEADRTLKRKAQEAYLAVKLSQTYSKDQILEFYVNKVFMNYNSYGMQTASKYYYGKTLDKLDLAQTALIAGMPNAPTIYNAYIYPEKAKWRRNLVLKAMLNNKKITNEQYQKAVNEDITKGLRKSHPTGNKQRLIDDPYIKEVVNEVQKDGFDPYRDNLRITVNIDQKAQNYLYKLANKDNNIPFTSNKMQVAATVLDPSNGHVVANIGGRHLPKIQMGLDRSVQTDRSTGSSIKPVLDYAPAIQYKYWSTAHTVQDTPYTYKGTDIKLYDWDNKFQGAMTMRYALEQSRNVPAVRTLEEIGINKGSKFAKKLGVNVDPKQGLSVAIGANASTLQMAGAFGAFDNDGIYHKPQFVSKIEAPDGLTRNYNTSGTRVMRDSTAYMITDMLKDVISKGSGKKAKITDFYQAGKTGTVKYSDGELAQYPDYKDTPKDSWFVGYTKNYVIAVWTGYDKINEGTISKSGQDAAQLFYKYAMQYMMKGKESTDWEKPSSVIARKYTGGNVTTTELWVKGHAPSDDTEVTETDNNSTSTDKSKKTNSSKTRSTTVQKDPNESNDSDTKTTQNNSTKDDKDQSQEKDEQSTSKVQEKNDSQKQAQNDTDNQQNKAKQDDNKGNNDTNKEEKDSDNSNAKIIYN